MAGLLSFWGESWLGFVNLTVPATRPLRLLWRHGQLAGNSSLCPRREETADEVAQPTWWEAALELGSVYSDGEAISTACTPDHGPSAPFLVKGLVRSRVRK